MLPDDGVFRIEDQHVPCLWVLFAAGQLSDSSVAPREYPVLRAVLTSNDSANSAGKVHAYGERLSCGGGSCPK
ncbi:hypothetical protein AWC16_10815 [Mycolicibacter longobardus]|uniref:Uncharacterized protein n=1 Tax=Mycolicibacter longobardus TaxID=1108812 RepID=A0A1X1YKB0_9MYCO|nr:hypothetical protein AWC16_10815 [Mycolicibacter longobardus]